MANRSEKKTLSRKAVVKTKCLDVAKRGILTGQDFANFMSALMSDLIEGKVAPNIGNAACNAGGKLLRIVELQMRYGTTNPAGEKVLKLALSNPLLPKADEQVQ